MSVVLIKTRFAYYLGFMHVFFPGLNLKNKTKLIALIAIISTMINAVLNYTLIPIYGLVGASIATLAASALAFFAYVFCSQKYFFIPINCSLLILPYSLLGAVVLIVWNYNFVLSLIAKFVIVLAYVLLLVLLKVIKTDEWKKAATYVKRL